MRGRDVKQAVQISTRSLDERIPMKHPIRKLRVLVDHSLHAMDSVLAGMYDAERGRESIPPEWLIRALVLQSMFSIRSERQLIEHIEYNLLYRWFVGLESDQKVWNHSTFSANRERLLKHKVMRAFFDEVVGLAQALDLVSIEHFSADGTLIQAYGAMKRFVNKAEWINPAGVVAGPAPATPAEKAVEAVVTQAPAAPASATEPTEPEPPYGCKNPYVDFRGEKRSNATHFCATDPEALSARKSNCHPAQLSVMGHALMENRHGFIVDIELTQASGTAECTASELMAQRSIAHPHATLGEDKAYDTQAHSAAFKDTNVTLHTAQNNKGRKSYISDDLALSEGYIQSIRERKRIEEFFGWTKCTGMLRKSRFVGVKRTGMAYQIVAAGYNLVRLLSLIGGCFKPLTDEARPI